MQESSRVNGGVLDLYSHVIKIRIGWTEHRSKCLSGNADHSFAVMPSTTLKPAIIPSRMKMLPTVPLEPLSQGSHSRFVFMPLK